ncbi:60 kDa SS-A/Ro ribonucleoprotein-like [Contarinia nasturtii]|uniref:60 kDa SS-A/Ro ribonucleoprotein-like n=1 Tax=Contarinia nasturtii TaxID=265458 RepID=UPI0012D3B0BE|nr:60 kDa SS-A/Ro ribonucleoprotein-like [Contarinia nasturtii]XP_031638717.1 60 kDa SS-A/Ro ribonucleoprotein-like [Contarinia nasturtii]
MEPIAAPDQEPMDPNPPPNLPPNPPIPPLSPETKLLRFLHTGTTSSSIPVKIDLELEHINTTLAFVILMARQNLLSPIECIKTVYQNKSYIRINEVLVALAYCAKQVEIENLRTAANTAAIDLDMGQNDFLYFNKYCAEISVVLRGQNQLNYGHGMCRVVEKWYAKFTAEQLANMFGEHRSLHGFTHRSVIKLSHFRTKKPDTTNPATEDDAIPSTSTQTTQTRASPPEPADEELLDREQVFKFIHVRGTQEYFKYLDTQPHIGPAAKRLKTIEELKVNENVDTAIQSIRDNQFTIEQLPAHLLETDRVWREILEYEKSTRTLLKHFNTLKDFRFLNASYTPDFATDFLKVFGSNKTAFIEENICPVFLYIFKQLYSKNIRHLGTEKARYYKQKVEKRNISTNKAIEKRLDSMFELALYNAKPINATFMIVMDPRKGNQKRTVVRNKHITCFEASLVLAYSIFQRENDALVYTYTDKKDKLNAIEWPKLKFAEARRLFEDIVESTQRTEQSLAQPILEAIKLKKKVDMFLVIVDSVARFCRQGQVPVEEFQKYRSEFNKHVKYVVLNLSRPTPDLIIPQGDDMKGFFEICGFNENTPKILNALASDRFT